jgi:VCBS repeat-containing protein
VGETIVAQNPNESATIGTVTAIVGEVKATGTDGVVRILTAGDTVATGEVIETSANGAVHIQLANGRALECGPRFSGTLNPGLLDLASGTRIALDGSIINPAVAVAPAPGDKPAITSTSQDIAALQAAIAGGADPSRIAQASAAGGAAPGAGGADGGGGTPLLIEQANSQGQVTSGIDGSGGKPLGFPDLTTTELATVQPEGPPLTPPPPPVISVDITGIRLVPPPDGDPDTPPETVTVSGNIVSLVEGTSPGADPGKILNFVLVLDKASDVDVVVTYTITALGEQNDIDLVDLLGGTVTVPAGVTQILVPIKISQDHNVEIDDSFELVITSATNATINPNASTAILNIINDDEPPLAQDDAYTVNEGENGTTLLSSVLTRTESGETVDDSGADAGEILTVTSTGTITTTQGGQVQMNADGTFYYFAPNAEFNGTDSFTYTMTDGFNGESEAVVTITVGPVNDPPEILVGDGADRGAVTEDVVLATSGQLEAIDIDSGATATWTVLPAVFISPAGNLGSFSVDQSGHWSYTLNNGVDGVPNPAQNLSAGQTITEIYVVRVTDEHGAFDDQEITITITGTNDLPTVTGGLGAVEEDGVQIAEGDIVFRDIDVQDVKTLTITSADGEATQQSWNFQPTSLPGPGDPIAFLPEFPPVYVIHGAYGDLQFILALKHWTYQLDNSKVQFLAEGQQITETFPISFSDDKGGVATSQIVITITGKNDVPDAVDNAYSVAEDGALIVTGILGNDSVGGDGGTLAVIANTQPSHGTLLLNANGSFTYTPTANYNGPDSFTYTIEDADGDTDTATVSITVTPVNDLPNAVDNAYSVNEDSVLTIALPGVLAGDTTGGDGGVLAVTSYTQPAHGTLTLDANGGFVYTPAANYNGPDSFTYTIQDADGDTDTATVAITVNPVNDLPNAVNNAYSVNEDSALVLTAPGILGNDTTGGDGGTLAVTSFTQPAHGTLTLNANGSFTYTPAANYNGPDSFTYTIEDADGDTDTATVSITVNPVDDAPNINVTSAPGEVYESALPGGSAATATESLALSATPATTTTGSLQVGDPDGLASVTHLNINNTDYSVAALADGETLQGSNGTLVISYVAATGVVSYEYTLTTPAFDQPASDEQEIFEVKVKDNTGRYSDPAAITINIVDDTPLVAPVRNAAMANEAGNVLTDEIPLTFGADGAGSVVLSGSHDGAYWTLADGTTRLTSEGHDLLYRDSNGYLEAFWLDGGDERIVFTVTYNGDGTYTVEQTGVLDGGAVNFAVGLTASNGGGHNEDAFFPDDGNINPANDKPYIVVFAEGFTDYDRATEIPVNFNNNAVGVDEGSKINADEVLFLSLTDGADYAYTAQGEIDTDNLPPELTYLEVHEVDVSYWQLGRGDVPVVQVWTHDASGNLQLVSATPEVTANTDGTFHISYGTAFDTVTFAYEGNGNGYGVSQMSGSLTSAGFDQSIQLGVSVTDSDNDATPVTNWTFTFDGDAVLDGSDGNDILVGGGLLSGGDGSDVFAVKEVGNPAVVTDFSTTEGDKLDISAVFSGGQLPADLAGFVTLVEQNGNTSVMVDVDGSGNNYQLLATLEGVTGKTLDQLLGLPATP